MPLTLDRRPRRGREIVAVIDPAWAAPGTDVTTRIRPPVDAARATADRLSHHLQHGEEVGATDDGRLTLRLRHEDRAARPVRLQQMAYHAVEELDALAERNGVVDLGVGWAHVSRKQSQEQAEEHAAEAAAESVRERDLQPRVQGAHIRTRRPRVNLWTAGHQVLLATAGVAVLPFLALVGLHTLGFDASGVVYWTVVGALAVTAGLIWAECSHAVDPPARRHGRPARRRARRQSSRRTCPTRPTRSSRPCAPSSTRSTPAASRSCSPTTPRSGSTSRTTSRRWPGSTPT